MTPCAADIPASSAGPGVKLVRQYLDYADRGAVVDPHASAIAAEIRDFEAALDRKTPGASAHIRGYRPVVNHAGAVELNPIIHARSRPDSVHERLARMHRRAESWTC